MHRDVHAGVAHDIAGVIKAARVAELGEDRDRRQTADAEDLIDQRATAGLLRCVGAQVDVERDELEIQCVVTLSAIVSCSRAAAGAGGRRGGRAPRESAAATRFADARADAGSERGRGDRGCARAGSTTPATCRSAAALADDGRRPSRSSRASFCPSEPASAGSARCTSAPTCSSSSTTNRQPVVASNATSSGSPLN